MEWFPNIHQLKTLLLVDRHRSFRGAAEAQHLTVSAVSQQMLNLSRKANAVLYERRGNETRLTPAGRLLADFAQQIVNLTEQAVEAMASSAKHRRLRVSTVTSIAEGILLKLHKSFRNSSADITLQIDIKPGTAILDELNNGSIDVGLIPLYTENRRELESLFHQVVYEDEIVAVVGQLDPLALLDAVSIEELAKRRLFLESQSSPNCQRLIEKFDAKNLDPLVELHCTNNTLTIQMALASGGVALVPKIVAESAEQKLDYVPLIDGVSRSLVFCCPRYIVDDPAVSAFRSSALKCFKKL